MTAFATLRPEIRAAVGDWGSLRGGVTVDAFSYRYRDDMIDAAITLVAREIKNITASDSTISPSLTDDTDYLIVVYSVAFVLLVAEVDTAYSTLGEKFTKSAPINGLNTVALKLHQLQLKKEIPVAVDTDVDLYANENRRIIADLQNAVNGGTSSEDEVATHYTKTFTNVTIGVVEHGFGMHPIVRVEDANGKEVKYPVTHDSDNQFTVGPIKSAKTFIVRYSK